MRRAGAAGFASLLSRRRPRRKRRLLSFLWIGVSGVGSGRGGVCGEGSFLHPALRLGKWHRIEHVEKLVCLCTLPFCGLQAIHIN